MSCPIIKRDSQGNYYTEPGVVSRNAQGFFAITMIDRGGDTVSRHFDGVKLTMP